VAIRSDRKIFAAACWDGRVRVYEYKSRKAKVLASLAYHGDVATSVCFAGMDSCGGGSGLLASASRDGTVALWPVFLPPLPAATATAVAGSTGEEREEQEAES
jgi:WD40 repeat protein